MQWRATEPCKYHSSLAYTDFPGGSDGKESDCSVGDPSFISGSGRSPGEENGNPLQYPCLENPMDRGSWRATVHGVTKSQPWLQGLTHTHTHTHTHFSIYTWMPATRVPLPPWIHCQFKWSSTVMRFMYFSFLKISIFPLSTITWCFLEATTIIWKQINKTNIKTQYHPRL